MAAGRLTMTSGVEKNRVDPFFALLIVPLMRI
jgi:hypothetical protein